MTEFEQVLQQCLHDLEAGAVSVEECLRRYPKHALELEPVLLTSAYLDQARDLRLSDPFRVRVRAKLMQEMHAHPRRRVRIGFLFPRLATGFAAILLALLVTGTVYAQRALPGETFYPWKLLSENAWRVISPDPVSTDLILTERRVDELIAIRDDPTLYAQTMDAYLDVADRLRSEINAQNETRILQTLDAQIEELNQSGINVPQPDGQILPLLEEPTLTPTPFPSPVLNATNLPILESSPIIPTPTELPQIVPTVQAPSQPTVEIPPVDVPSVEVPPVKNPPEIVPTVEIPPLLP